MFYYKIYNQIVQTYFEINFLDQVESFSKPDIIIERDDSLDHDNYMASAELRISGDISEYNYCKPKLIFAKILAGQKILVKHLSNLNDISLSLSILNIPLGYCLYQKKFLVLHSSAVLNNEDAILFLGRSGSGKSTTAALLNETYSFVTEDVACINMEGHPSVLPSIPFIKLDAFGRSVLDLTNEAIDIPDDRLSRKYYKAPKQAQKGKIYKIAKCIILKCDEKLSFNKSTTKEILKASVECSFSAFPFNVCKQSSILLSKQFSYLTSAVDFYTLRRPKKIDKELLKQQLNQIILNK